MSSAFSGSPTRNRCERRDDTHLPGPASLYCSARGLGQAPPRGWRPPCAPCRRALSPDIRGSPNPEAVKQVVARAFEDKTLLITCGTYDKAIRIVPPLVVNEEHIRDFLGVYRRAVASVA